MYGVLATNRATSCSATVERFVQRDPVELKLQGLS